MHPDPGQPADPEQPADAGDLAEPGAAAEPGVLRSFTPAAASCVYLNTGTCGPLLAPVAEAMARAAQEELVAGRVGLAAFDRLGHLEADLRLELGRLVGAGADEMAVTHHTTEGMNTVVWGFPWRHGDRVVTTTLEHIGGLLPLYQLHRRRGVQIDFAGIGNGGRDETLAALEGALRRPARLLVISHVTYGTGAVLPLAEIVSLAHSRGALVAVDGAQSVGVLPVDVHALGVDFYAFPGQKWLCGPEGTGALFVRRDRIDDLQPTFVGYMTADHDAYRADDPDSLVPAPGATRYEVGSPYRPGLVGLGEAVRWHSAVGSGHRVIERAYRLAGHAIEAVSALPGARVLTPTVDHAGLVAFDVPGCDAGACVSFLEAQGVMIRSIPESGALRLSCGFFNTPEEIDHCVSLIRGYLASR